jgi:hypothetical protein
MKELETWLLAYETDVRFPDVSGMEHLDMLTTRSKIAERQNNLTNEQRLRLEEADRALLNQVAYFYQAIRAIADLAQWREQVQAPASHWWWYLDVLAQAPLPSRSTTESAFIVSS